MVFRASARTCQRLQAFQRRQHSEEIKDTNPHLKSLYEGLVMTEVHVQVFTQHDLTQVEPTVVQIKPGFDSYRCEALFHVLVKGKEPDSVVLVNKVGCIAWAHPKTYPAASGETQQPLEEISLKQLLYSLKG